MAERGTVFCLPSVEFSVIEAELFPVIPRGSSVEYSLTPRGIAVYTSRHADLIHDRLLARSNNTRQPWIAVVLEEGATWSYFAFQGNTMVDRFSTCRGFWGDTDQAEWLGDASLLANMFSIPQVTIDRYLVPWTYLGNGDFAEQGYAYPDDPPDCGYGMVYQCAAFFRALGFAWPQVTWRRS